MSKEELISSLYPPPPPYVKFFSDENLNQLEEWKTTKHSHEKENVNDEDNDNENEKEVDNKAGNEDEDEQVPPGELRFLIPPKPPSGTHYRGYGNLWSFEDKLPSLKEANWEQLYSHDDETITSELKIKELHKLMDSLLLNFYELIGIASIDPQQYQNKIKDISLILININHLLNTYRPHQSRESLIMLLKKQIDVKQKEINQLTTVTNEIKSKILNLVQLDELKDRQAIEFDQFKHNITKGDTDKKTQLKDDIIRKLLAEV
ncbi:mediator of RNA polymerase II transcription subunit 7 [Scheffersomyces amazonensis]|uniref:mediator of RNA polymerase II transcription subunit 7 n=1 Tax=Scheffersomyces amazonensis TaxID=1078765 RepID=UPI00315CDD6D